MESQRQLQQSFNTFNTTSTGFSDHFYSVHPAPVPPPEFYPHQPFYPPPLPPPPMDDWWIFLAIDAKGGEIWMCDLGGAHVLMFYSLRWTLFSWCLNSMCVGLLALHVYLFACMNLLVELGTWFVICDELCWFALNLETLWLFQVLGDLRLC